jgi:hypothetical protein
MGGWCIQWNEIGYGEQRLADRLPDHKDPNRESDDSAWFVMVRVVDVCGTFNGAATIRKPYHVEKNPLFAHSERCGLNKSVKDVVTKSVRK